MTTRGQDRRVSSLVWVCGSPSDERRRQKKKDAKNSFQNTSKAGVPKLRPRAESGPPHLAWPPHTIKDSFLIIIFWVPLQFLIIFLFYLCPSVQIYYWNLLCFVCYFTECCWVIAATAGKQLSRVFWWCCRIRTAFLSELHDRSDRRTRQDASASQQEALFWSLQQKTVDLQIHLTAESQRKCFAVIKTDFIVKNEPDDGFSFKIKARVLHEN